MTKYAVGQKIYYAGDMANRPGWFTVTEAFEGTETSSQKYTLTEIDGTRQFKNVWNLGIGEVYKGNCNPRFVTEEAYKTYREEQQKQLEAWLNKNAVNA